MKGVWNKVLPTDFPDSDMVIIEQCEFIDEICFFTWKPEDWEKQKRRPENCRTAVFVVKPKVINHQSTIQL